MNARDEAFRQLTEAALPGWKLTAPRPGKVAPRDIDLAHAIARTVTKNFRLLRHLVAHYAGRPLRQIDDRAQAVLAIALAQLRYFDRIPPYAVVDEAVEQTKRLKLGKASGFVNAVLRRAIREPDAPLPSKDNLDEYADIALSHPPELFRRMCKRLGKADALKLAERHNAEPPLIARGQPPVTEGVEITPHTEPGFFIVRGAGEAALSDWSARGLAQPQDPTSAKVVDALDATAARNILDRCCGVGTKTLQIARIAPQAAIYAIDPAEHRMHALKRAMRLAEISNIHPIVSGETAALDESLLFDRILIDAPCSNSGVIIRRPESRYRQDEKALQSLGRLQRRILGDTLPRLAPGGLLVYSTCSIWEDENEQQVQWLLAQRDGLRLIDQKLTLPSLSSDAAQHHDGGYLAVIRLETTA